MMRNQLLLSLQRLKTVTIMDWDDTKRKKLHIITDWDDKIGPSD